MADQPGLSPLTDALRRILLPLARLMIGRGVRLQSASDQLKEAYLAAAAQLAAGRPTVSRLSVLTGLQRKDIKAIRARMASEQTPPPSAGPLPRLIQNWRSLPRFLSDDGTPAQLPRAAFDDLARTVSTDIHPRSLLDELTRLDLVRTENDTVTLLAEAFVPGADQAALYTYLGNNLGDHAEAAVGNVLADGPAPHFERAVHYNRLSPDALAELDALARRLQQAALEQIAARAAELQDGDGADTAAHGRFRCGAFILTETAGQPEENP